MVTPHATYRLQLRAGMDFVKARAILPYLEGLGISHLYLSPIFTAQPGSSHGYDVTDYNEIDPALGGKQGFEALCADLKRHKLGLILDIVPNHMAASVSNGWWADVLRNGRRSAYASHFDIDWSQPLTLPILGKPLSQTLSADELRLQPSRGEEGWQLAYYDQHLPLCPESWELAASGPGDDQALITQVHERQHWRLTFWKDARKHLSYRRFFEVTGLVGMRVEDPVVFQDTHRLIFTLIDKGLVDGLRVDHVDGLSRPADYLARLRSYIGAKPYLVVEKITEGDEKLPANWPVDGTTGYDFIAGMALALVDPHGVQRLDQEYAALCGHFDLADETRAAKQQMLSHNFAGEVDRLTALAARELSMDMALLREVISELVIAFPVYRSYADGTYLSPHDASLLEDVRRVAARRFDENHVNAVVDLLKNGKSQEFQIRFQQLTGPIMAKAVEDTLFYRDHRMLALNEVGGNPADGRNAAAERAHQHLAGLVTSQPRGIRATATHDTKRGEDARARLYALSEMAADFASGVSRWRAMIPSELCASRCWMIFQALAGIWPIQIPQPKELEAMRARFLPYLEKAMREAKCQTSWTEPNLSYEQAVLDYAGRLFDEQNAAFHADFTNFVRRIHLPGWMNSLAQTTIKLMVPGVPDIYQGSELFDDSLVDPDNRRPIDFAGLANGMPGPCVSWQNWRERRAKQALISALLGLRAKGSARSEAVYRLLFASGKGARHCFAFATELADRQVIVAVPRLTAGLFDASGSIPAGAWGSAILPVQLTGPMRNVLTGQRLSHVSTIGLAELFARGPISVLVAEAVDQQGNNYQQ